jgi:hypothetical protein
LALPAFSPSLDKEMARGVRDGKISFSATCISLQTVCEQSASFLGSPLGVHQFVIEMHHSATMATPKAAPRQPKMRSGT